VITPRYNNTAIYVYSSKNELIESFANKKNCWQHYNMHHKTLNKYIKSGELYNGLYFKLSKI
jgi:hypothetical protein